MALKDVIKKGSGAPAPTDLITGGIGVDTANKRLYFKAADGTVVPHDLNTPAGNIAATTVQGAINALDTEKANIASPSLTGVPLAPTAPITTNSTQVATTAFVQNVSANNAGMRNRIINGACNIAQRGTSVSVPNNTGGYGGPDRFTAYNSNSGGAFTQSQSSLTYNGVVKNTIRSTINTVPTSLTGTNAINPISQRIEGFNCYDLLGNNVSVSFIFNTNVAGTYSISIADSGATNSYVTTFTVTANTPTRITKTINIPTNININIPNNSGTSIYFTIGFLNTSTFQTSTLDAWQSGNFLSANTNTNWAASIYNFIELTDLQLEKGSIATPFENRPYGMELALCQRYYQKDVYNLSGATSGTGLTGFVICSFPVTMRDVPTFTHIAVGNLSDGQSFYTGTGTAGAVTILKSSIQISVTSATSFGGSARPLTAYSWTFSLTAEL
jgi:hypothetical protein